jgi:hypothetical protein
MTFSEETLTAYFGRIWPAHNDAFCELLVRLRQQFDGDLERMPVLGIIGSRTLARGRVEGMSYVEFISRERREDKPAPINLQSIADYSGIPRETVRRKVRDLEQQGWIIRRDNGYLIATAKAAQDLEPATKATLRYLATVAPACTEATSG